MKFLKRNMDIIIILVVGFALRFSISIIHSYSNDELSAINRLQYDNFHDLIELGVKSGDMHPAGVQLFMKGWSQIAGTGELGMRLPFVLAGTFSILVIFLIARKWLNREIGIIAAILLAFLYFPIMNSEFARPYSPGLLFSLLSAWFCLKILFDSSKSYIDAVLLGFSMAAAMYTHYFAFMFVAWLGLSAFIFVNKETVKYLLIAGAIAILLFLPHFGITQYQLGVGGLQWLGPPDNDWLFQFLFHVFNESWWVIITLGIGIILAFVFRKNIFLRNRKVIWLVSLWFFGIYLIGHLYSILETPILKFPVMLFPLPFLLLMIATILSRFRYQAILCAALMVVTAISTIREKDLFGHMHYELFEEIAVDIVTWNKTYGEENIYTVYNINNPNYINFYANQWGDEIDIDWDVIEFGDTPAIREALMSRKERYCIVGYSARLTLTSVFETCKEFYPNIISYKKYNNSAVFLLGKDGTSNLRQQRAVLTQFKPNEPASWVYFPSQLLTDTTDSVISVVNDPTYILNEKAEYGPDYVFQLDQIEEPYSKYIKVTVWADMNAEGQLTAAVSGTRNGEPITYRGDVFWIGADLERMIQTSGKGYLTFAIPEYLRLDDQLKISLWNRNPKSPIGIRKILVEVYDNIWN